MRRAVRIANARDGGLWWRAPMAAAVWLAVALPIIAGLVAITMLRRWSRDLLADADLAAWRA